MKPIGNEVVNFPSRWPCHQVGRRGKNSSAIGGQEVDQLTIDRFFG